MPKFFEIKRDKWFKNIRWKNYWKYDEANERYFSENGTVMDKKNFLNWMVRYYITTPFYNKASLYFTEEQFRSRNVKD